MTAITAPAPAQRSLVSGSHAHMACSQENSVIRAGAIHTQHGIQETGASSSPKHAVTHKSCPSCPRRWQRSASSSAGTASAHAEAPRGVPGPRGHPGHSRDKPVERLVVRLLRRADPAGLKYVGRPVGGIPRGDGEHQPLQPGEDRERPAPRRLRFPVSNRCAMKIKRHQLHGRGYSGQQPAPPRSAAGDRQHVHRPPWPSGGR